MDTARNKYTGEIVDAAELWLIDRSTGVDRLAYECRGCGELARPISFEPGKMVRPHFRIDPYHLPDCDVDGIEKLVRKGRTQRLRTLDGFPCSVPNRLVLDDSRAVTSLCGMPSTPSSSGEQSIHSPERLAAFKGRKKRAYAVKTIRPICRTFLSFPHDRDLPLHVPGLYGSKYQEIFHRLRGNAVVRYTTSHIFYAPLFWRDQPQKNQDGFIDVLLACGEWSTNPENGKNELFRPYRLQIGADSWSAAKKEYVSREISTSRHDFKEKWKEGSPQRAWVFFAGKQDKNDPALFRVEDHRLVCCIVEEMIYPSTPYTRQTRPTRQSQPPATKRTGSLLNASNLKA